MKLKLRLSVSTKIFVGFAVVIVAFGSACIYTLYSMSALRSSVTLVYQDIVPLSARLVSLSRQVRTAEEFVGLRRPTDAQWLQRLLPTIRPFEALAEVEQSLERLQAAPVVDESGRLQLARIRAELRTFREGTDMIEGDGPLSQASSHEELFVAANRATVRLAHEGRLKASAPEVRTLVSMLRRTNRVIVTAGRSLDVLIQDLNEQAARDEKTATLAVLVIAAGALLLSTLILWMSHRTLAPIRSLREGARRIAAGHYDERVGVSSADEIGQLAEEFNRMASALRERDEALAKQREELLRAERLATIGKVAAQITHEVRNPLSSIGLNAELLEEELAERDGADSESAALLRAIHDEVQRLKGITEQYLRYARLPSPDLVEVDVADLMSRFVDFFGRELTASGIKWTLDAAADGGALVQADPDQLRQAILNIARNAADATRERTEGGGQIDFAVAVVDDEVRITIGDDGPGIDPALMDQIFEPFVTSKRGGTGLGLALSHQIVVEHVGRIDVSRPRQDAEGTIFTIGLPLAVAIASTESSPT